MKLILISLCPLLLHFMAGTSAAKDYTVGELASALRLDLEESDKKKHDFKNGELFNIIIANGYFRGALEAMCEAKHAENIDAITFSRELDAHLYVMERMPLNSLKKGFLEYERKYYFLRDQPASRLINVFFFSYCKDAKTKEIWQQQIVWCVGRATKEMLDEPSKDTAFSRWFKEGRARIVDMSEEEKNAWMAANAGKELREKSARKSQ